MSVTLLDQRREKKERGSSLESRVSALENYIAMLIGSGDIANGAVKNVHIGESVTVGNTDAKCTDANADNTAANAQAYSWITGTKPPTDADATQATLNLGAAIDYAKANGVTLIQNGYIRTGLINASYINTGVLSVSYTAAKCTNANADQTSLHTAYDITHAGGASGWLITAGYIKSYNGTIELKGSNTPHIKALYDVNNYVQMTGEGNVPRFDVYGGGYLRTRLNKDSLNFFGATGSSICTFYAKSTAGPGMYIDTPSNPLYVVAPQLVVDGSTLYLNYGTAQNSLVANGTNITFGGNTSANLLPNATGYNLGSATKNWNNLYLSGQVYMDNDDKIYFGSCYIGYTNSMLYLGRSTHIYGYLRLHQYTSNPTTETGSMWAYSSGGINQFRGEPSSGWSGSFDMTAI